LPGTNTDPIFRSGILTGEKMQILNPEINARICRIFFILCISAFRMPHLRVSGKRRISWDPRAGAPAVREVINPRPHEPGHVHLIDAAFFP
jgi:hypothetical protein